MKQTALVALLVLFATSAVAEAQYTWVFNSSGSRHVKRVDQRHSIAFYTFEMVREDEDHLAYDVDIAETDLQRILFFLRVRSTGELPSIGFPSSHEHADKAVKELIQYCRENPDKQVPPRAHPPSRLISRFSSHRLPGAYTHVPRRIIVYPSRRIPGAYLPQTYVLPPHWVTRTFYFPPPRMHHRHHRQDMHRGQQHGRHKSPPHRTHPPRRNKPPKPPFMYPHKGKDQRRAPVPFRGRRS